MGRSNTKVSIRVVEAVARAKEDDIETVPPLYEAVDPDALDALFNPAITGAQRRRPVPMIQFSYAGRTVVVRSVDDIEVRKPTDKTEGTPEE